MSQYPAYPVYKYSGVEWLGEIPAHWEVKRTKFIVSYIGSGKTPKGGSEVYVDEGIMMLRSQNVYDDGLRLDDVVYITDEADDFQSSSRVTPNDVLLNITGASIGRASLVPSEFPNANVNQHVCILRPDRDRVIPNYLHLLLCSKQGKEQIFSQENGTSREGLNFQQAGNLVFALPPLREQQLIARFLDGKTAQIDALIAKKESLLARLAEKRTALISQAVTKGLDPTAPMKDSGIPWLGEIPSRWNVIRIRYCSEFITSGSRGWSQYFTDDGDIFLRIANVTRDSINLKLSDIQRVSPPEGSEGRRTNTVGNDVIVSITADLGCVGVIPHGFESAYVSQHLALIRLQNNKVVSRWLAYQIFSHSGKAQLLGSGYGGTKIQLGLTDIKDVWIAVPSISEQQIIVQFLDEQIANIDQQKGKIEEAITALKEYRTALITNAVTGKIDLRAAVLPDRPTAEAAHA